MKNTIRAAVVGLIASLCVGFVGAPPASAGGYFTHHSPDAGRNDPFIIIPSLANLSVAFPLYEGQSTIGRVSDADAIRVQPGTVIVCRYWQGWGYVWVDTFHRNHNEGFGYGVWKINDVQGFTCVTQAA